MAFTADRCAETHSTAGTGTVTLLGAIYAHQSFSTACAATAVQVEYAMYSQTSNDWEVGVGTYDGSTGLSRDVILASSNSGNVITCSGTYVVFMTASAKGLLNPIVGGFIHGNSLALP